MNIKNGSSEQERTMTLEECEANLSAAQQEITELHEKYLRAAAAIDNTRKQAERDATQRLNQRLRSLFLRLIEVADTLDRALAFVPKGDAIRPGIEAAQQQLQAVLQQEGVVPIRVVAGVSFDPRRQEAITVQESNVDHATVTEIVQNGYTFDGQVLRPARVVVTRPVQSKI
jgi:molecular chaperone GrpE